LTSLKAADSDDQLEKLAAIVALKFRELVLRRASLSAAAKSHAIAGGVNPGFPTIFIGVALADHKGNQ